MKSAFNNGILHHSVIPIFHTRKPANPIQFHTAEQYWKALLMGDDDIAEKILAGSGPAEAKALIGRWVILIKR